MPTYKGNAGHLMQHWTLCEILVTANKHAEGLNYIDAHAMAPLATERQHGDVHFDKVKNCSPSSGESAYELAWHQLVPREVEGYPNSAAFVEQVWEGKFAMLLCEKEHETCQKIEPWCQRVRKLEMCKEAKLSCGKWQERFKKELPSPPDVGLAGEVLTLISFDPNMCGYKNVIRPCSQNLYPKDIQAAMSEISRLQGGVLIQMSTYTANGGNSHERVIASMKQVLATKDFRLLGVVRLNGHMMSMVYGRNVPWAAELADLGDRFDKWLFAFWPRRKVKPLRLDWAKL